MVQALTTTGELATAVSAWFSNSVTATATYGPISDWDTSEITNMSWLFYNKSTFNEDISKWNTSKVTDMGTMFSKCSDFNQDISTKSISAANSVTSVAYTAWDTSKVTSMRYMFKEATAFNNGQPNNGASVPLNWDTSSVINMELMFYDAHAFNQPIDNWNVSNVTNMVEMFKNAKVFNQPIDWDTSSVTNMEYMFKSAEVFNQNIRSWDTLSGPVSTYLQMFNNANAMIAEYGEAGQNLITGWQYTPTSAFFNYVPPLPTCFPKGTPVTTNLGEVAIEKLNPDKHTIHGKKIVAITQTRPLQKHVVCFEKNSLGRNVPSQQTICSKEHKVLYRGEMIKARDLVDMCKNVKKVSYNREPLYNVLLEKHGKMLINNMICETLHPENIAAKFAKTKNSPMQRNTVHA